MSLHPIDVVDCRPLPAALRDRQRKGLPSPNRGKTFPPEPLTAREALRLLGATHPTSKAGVRNRALLALLYRSGLRSAEVRALFPKDFDPEGRAVTVLRGKGMKARVVGIDEPTVELVLRWLDVRGELGLTWREPLFCTVLRPNPGRPLSGSQLREMLPRLAEKADIGKRVHPHSLRHTHAVELMKEHVPVTIIQKQLGHRFLATTAHYLDHFMPEQVLATMRARRWDPDG